MKDKTISFKVKEDLFTKIKNESELKFQGNKSAMITDAVIKYFDDYLDLEPRIFELEKVTSQSRIELDLLKQEVRSGFQELFESLKLKV